MRKKEFFFSSRRRHTRCALVTGVQTCALPISYTPALRPEAIVRAFVTQYGLSRQAATDLLRMLHTLSSPDIVDQTRMLPRSFHTLWNHSQGTNLIGRASCRERVCQYV